MIVYLTTFALSLLGVWLADIQYEDKRMFLTSSLLAMLPPIVLAGFRDATVGTDMQVYILSTYEKMVSSGQGFLDFVSTYDGDLEILYLFINYLTAQFSDQPFLLLIIIHVLIIVPLFATAMKWRPYLSPVLFMFIYYMIFFQESLSIVRQSIALSFSMLAFTYLLEKKYVFYAVYSLVAIGFHNTAVIAFAFPLVFFIIKWFPLQKYYLGYLGLCVAFILFMMNIELLIAWLIDSGWLDYKYLKYTSLVGEFEAILGATNLVVKIAVLVYIAFVMLLYVPDTLVKTFLVLAVLDFVFSLCALIVQPLDRISLYFRLVSCLSIPYMLSNYSLSYSSGDRQYQVPVVYAWGVLLFFYWFYVYMLGNYDDTADYRLSTTLFAS